MMLLGPSTAALEATLPSAAVGGFHEGEELVPLFSRRDRGMAEDMAIQARRRSSEFLQRDQMCSDWNGETKKTFVHVEIFKKKIKGQTLEQTTTQLNEILRGRSQHDAD
jgi:hypothetical protein